MELKEGDRIVVSKPVPSRPTSFPKFRSFSELLAGAINTSPSNTCIENSVSAIRPKTVRFKSSGTDASQGNGDRSPQQTVAHVEARVHQPVSSSQTRIEKTPEPPNKSMADDKKYKSNNNQASYDGYNWRKYGQKQVKGSEYPRSYYKCTAPSCPVKKMVERSLNGEIAEIVYKGEHNHSRTQAPNRSIPSSRGQGQLAHENVERKKENNEGKRVSNYDHVVTCTNNENSFGVQGDCEEAEVEEPKTKKRKVETKACKSGEGEEEARVVVPDNPLTDSEIIGDGFRWRKYGQKVVKGNPYPRSYYRCTNLKCKVRKHVERAIDDPTSFVTTYEGKHNHEIPTKTTNVAPS